MYPSCLYGEPYEENSTGCHIVDERNKTIELLEKEVNSFKQALNEIREYINNTTTMVVVGKPLKLKDETSGQDILQIIDKVLGE